MNTLFLIFAIISLLLILDGRTLKKGRSKRIFVRQSQGKQRPQKIALIGKFMTIAGILCLIWTAIGYALNDLLIIEIFIVIYLGILAIVGLSLMVTFDKRFK